MRTRHVIQAVMVGLTALLVGCSSSTSVVGSLVLPTSNRTIDVVQHRSDVKTLDCTTMTVIQTYDASGVLIDAKSAQGRALHCDAAIAVIDAGAAVGAANQIRRGLAASASEISNVNSNAQSQGQSQGQSQSQGQGQKTGGVTVTNPPATTNGGGGGSPHGNNGGGNGSGDGTNPGTGHHHNNGDNS